MVEMSKAETSVGRVIKIGGKEFEINLEIYRVVQDYLKNSYTLDVLAEKLGLDGWAEAYEFLASLPQWMFWFTESQLGEYLSRQQQEEPAQQPTSRRAGRKRREQADEKHREGGQPTQAEGGEKQPASEGETKSEA